MRYYLLLIALVPMLVGGAEAGFLSYPAEGLRLDKDGLSRYDQVKKWPDVAQVRLIEINESSFSHGVVQLDLFDNQTDRFDAESGEQEGVWKGKREGSLNRFVIRRVRTGYSGHIFSNGHYYGIVPINSKASALYEMKESSRCGLGIQKGGVE